ncbi:hypothetical protein KM043_001640 [Ampulex compressa]|nr:hypothetical protein KM043_001640 [Ampulex compressa]
MGDMLKAWLRTRLGAMMDLAPETFAHHARDGTLLARILHGYDIIGLDQLETILRTHDPALCRVNLKHLRVWLRFIGIDCDEESIEEISRGRGTAALRLFYRVYLCLESKDRLHFVTLQKERERYVPASAKFDVSVVCEESPPYEPPEHPRAKRLLEAAETIEWHRANFSKILEACRAERERFEATRRHSVVRTVPRTVRGYEVSGTGRTEESEQADDFARKHRAPASRLEDYEPSKDGRSECLAVPPMPDPGAARNYVEWLESRAKRSALSCRLESRMRKALLSNLREKLRQERASRLEERLASRVLDRSRYEKRMMTKLCEIRDQKSAIAERRRMVDDLTLKAREEEACSTQDREREDEARDLEEVEMESRRLCELRYRIHERKVARAREKHWRICWEIVQDFVDVAILAAEYRAADDEALGECMPRSIWSELKTLFVECQPIFESVEKSNLPMRRTDDAPIAESASIERRRTLDEAAFESYRDLGTPWDEYAKSLGGEEREDRWSQGEIVLGYVVHRLLEVAYPRAIRRLEPPVPTVSVAALVLGIKDRRSWEILRELLARHDVRPVRMEDAIDHCLERYKLETKGAERVDGGVVSAMTSSEELESRKERTSRTRRPDVTGSPDVPATGEEETRTSREAPYDDPHPTLTETAYIGKRAYEFLALGQPISDRLATKILLEYLKSLAGAEGWALIGYPDTYDRMALLEMALGGRELPPDTERGDFRSVNIEDIDPTPPRITFEATELDPFASCRQVSTRPAMYEFFARESRLVPNPMTVPERNETSATFVTTYVKAMPKPKDLDLEESPSCQSLPEDASSMDVFYADRDVAYALYYSKLDPPTLKRLVSLIVGHELVPRNEETEGLTLDGGELSSHVAAPIVRRLVVRRSAESESLSAKEKHRESGEDALDENSNAKEEGARRPKPGEKDWKWADLPRSSALSEALARVWVNMENSYVENLKDMFFLKRTHRSAVIPYKDAVARSLRSFVERRDERQDMVKEFQSDFDRFDEDIRRDVEVKWELHRRVADFQAVLWEMCDRKRLEAEDERRRIVRDRWTYLESLVLVKVYVGILRAEIDRCLDTMRIVRDYYSSMLRKPLRDIEFPRIVLGESELDATGTTDPDGAAKAEPTVKSVRGKELKNERGGKSESAKSSGPKVALDDASLEEEIVDLLMNASKDPFDSEKCSVYALIWANIEEARAIVESAWSRASELLEKEERAISKTEKKEGERDENGGNSVAGKLAGRGQDLTEEWRCALAFEINRIRLRLEVLAAAARADVTFLLDTVRLLFHRLREEIVERYNREIKSVNDMANVFCYAIEESRAIEHELVLEGDRLVAIPKPFASASPAAPSSVSLEEEASPLRFRMSQLARLMDVFRRVAPHGSLAERSFVFILQDLSSRSEEEEGFSLLPVSWHDLRPRDVSSLVRRLFGTVQRVDWREFIVQAMDLPMPTHREILEARDSFAGQDPESRETVTRERYHETPLWFVGSIEANPHIGGVLRGDFQRDHEHLYEEELDALNRGNAGLAIGRGKRASGQDREERSSRGGTEGERRLTLAKELLCQMYLTDRRSVNYTALLLAFCKDEDSRVGLAKAFTLAMGRRVCSEPEEGEKYVEQLLEEKRRAKEEEATRGYLREEARQVTSAMLDLLMNMVLEDIESGVARRSFEASTANRRLKIERLDAPGEIDPADLLPEDSVRTELVAEADNSSRSSSGENELEDAPRSSWSSRAESCPRIGTETERPLVYWLPRNVCLTVLSATLPWHAAQSSLLDTSMNLSDAIALVYKDLEDENINDEKDVVLAHRLLNHGFVTDLLASTGKFTSKNVGRLVLDILQERCNDEDVQ